MEKLEHLYWLVKPWLWLLQNPPHFLELQLLCCGHCMYLYLICNHSTLKIISTTQLEWLARIYITHFTQLTMACFPSNIVQFKYGTTLPYNACVRMHLRMRVHLCPVDDLWLEVPSANREWLWEGVWFDANIWSLIWLQVSSHLKCTH